MVSELLRSGWALPAAKQAVIVEPEHVQDLADRVIDDVGDGARLPASDTWIEAPRSLVCRTSTGAACDEGASVEASSGHQVRG